VVSVSNQNINFAIEEYKAVRTEVDNLQKQSYLMESAVLLGFASVFVFTSNKNITGGFYWWCLFAVTIVGLLRKTDMSKRVEHLGKYILKLEEALYINSDLGWEKYIKNNGLKNHSTKIFWFTINAVALVMAIYKSIYS